LTSFPAPCSAQERLIIKFNDEEIEELTDEIIVLGKNEFELDLSDYLYECINLTVPAYIRCEELGDGLQCDEEMVKTIQNLAPTEPEEAKTDPRWEALKGIKNN